MARAKDSDYLHSMRFFVKTVDGDSFDAFTATWEGAQAGFSACTTPELSTEAVEYREGNYIYTRKFPGLPTTADITLSRGVTRVDTDFYNWMLQAVEGSTTDRYRADLVIQHFGRSTLPGANLAAGPQTTIDTSGTPDKQYLVFEAFPIRAKVAADLDATASDVSIAEMDVAYENFQMIASAG